MMQEPSILQGGEDVSKSSTNNVGEYNGVKNLLQNAASMGITHILIVGDSQSGSCLESMQ